MWLVLHVLLNLVPLLSQMYSKMDFAAPCAAALNSIAEREQPGESGGFSAREISALLKLRAREDVANLLPQVHPYFHKDHVLIRFLRAKNLDVTDAAQMIAHAVKWRNDNRMDSILNETILNFKSPPYTFEGFDYEGRPVAYFSLAPYDVRKLLIGGKRNQVLRTLLQLLERGLVELRNGSIQGKRGPDGKEIIQAVVIFDASGFSLVKHFCVSCPSIFIEWIKQYESNYPDSIKYLVMINVLRSWIPLIETFSPVLTPTTQRALKIFGPEKQDWSKFLLQIIPPDQLPTRYGGTNVKVV